MEINTTSETGIDVTKYSEEKNSGAITLTRPEQTANCVLTRKTYKQEIVAGVPSFVAGVPSLQNVNRKSLEDLDDELLVAELKVIHARAEIAVMMADMLALGV